MTPLDEYRIERSRALEREVEFLRGERRRLEALLADALTVAVAGTGVSALALLEQIALLNGTNLGCAAYVDERERRHAQNRLDRVLRVLRETA
jgi:hypothetical protein